MATRRTFLTAIGTAAATMSAGTAVASSAPPGPSLYSHSVLEELRLNDEVLVLTFKDNPLVGDYGGADLRSDFAELDTYQVRNDNGDPVLTGSYTPGDDIAKHPLSVNENGRVPPGTYELVLSAVLGSKNGRGAQKTISEVITFTVTDYNGLEQTVTLDSQEIEFTEN